MNGTSPDVELKKEDIFFIPSTIEMRGEQTLTISGEVSYPGTYEFAENTTIEDFILQAGGLKNTASVTNIDVNRRIYDSKATERSDTLIERYHFALKDGFIIDGEPTFTLMPFDEVHVRKSPVSSGIKNVSISGAVNFGGHYAITNKNYRVSDLIKDAGGLTNQAYTAGVRLYRKTRAEGERQNEIAIRNSRAQSYQERLRFDENYDMEIADALTMLRLRDDEEYTIAIDLDNVIKNPGSEDDIILCENDRLYIPEIEHTVKIRGEVNQTISVKYKKGMKVKDYIKQAGGYTDMAKKNSLYAIHLNGAVSKISKSSSKNITPGCEIIVPAKRIKKKASMSETMAITSATATLATVIVSLVTILK
jgi:protein involved in polysaccharide export with SLBB domain